MMLYCKDLTHFQLAVLTQGEAPGQRVFLLHEVSEQIREQYNRNNKDIPMGTQEFQGFR